MRTLRLTCADPKLWREDYDKGHMLELEFYTFLTMCAKSAPPQSIVEVVPQELLPAFKKYIFSKASLENDDDIIFFGGTQLYSVKDAQKIAEWLVQQSQVTDT